jgi:hypothetical protein
MIKKINSVYVAASSNEIDRAQRWIDMLGKAGIECTSTWIESIKKVGESNPYDATPEVRRTYASENESCVRSSDLLWFLVPAPIAPNNHGRGGYYEAGMAKSIGKVLVFSGDTRQSVFCAHGIEFVEDIDAFAHICKLAREDTYL